VVADADYGGTAAFRARPIGLSGGRPEPASDHLRPVVV
jgi:hypothetical protein